MNRDLRAKRRPNASSATYGTTTRATSTPPVVAPSQPAADREHHREQPEPDERLELERLVPRADAARDDGADAEHRREVEGVRADDDPDRDGVLVLEERRDRGRDLRRVGGERGEQAEQRLGQAEPQPDAVEPPREHGRRDEHQRDGGDEEWDGGCGRHRLDADQPSRHTGANANAERLREPDPRAGRWPWSRRRPLLRPRGPPAPEALAVITAPEASSLADRRAGLLCGRGEQPLYPVSETHSPAAYAMIGV